MVLKVKKMGKIFKQYLRNHYNYPDLLRNKSKNANIERACYQKQDAVRRSSCELDGQRHNTIKEKMRKGLNINESER